ncbi:MAG: type III-B CRISPR module RAMP protein Cmr1 [Candidatus Brocadiaceae bacterium]|nr:type III-B CRISPR module RAMP protein Cmr1 [Candidatus Brocadiaceae bacterium]
MTKIEKISFEIETVTPMFLAGADGKTAELRPASLKGLLRYWWRALQSEPNLDKLREKEAKIFGSSDEGIGGSKFAIRVTQPDKSPLLNFKDEIKDSRQQNRIDANLSGIGYLFYSTYMQRGKERPYFPVKSKFTVTISSQDEKSLKAAIVSLWVLAHLGGLGTRARRGAGNIAINSIEGAQKILNDMKLDFVSKGTTSEEVARWLINNFESAKRVINESRTAFVSEYTNLSFSRFVIGGDNKTWKEALNHAGDIFKKFRDNNKSRIFETAVFGFPIVHRSSRTTVTGKESEVFVRRSSPIIFKIIKVDDRYYWMVIRLSGELLPQGGVISADKKTQKPDYGIIDEFWAELKKTGEHILSMPDTLLHVVEEIKKSSNPRKIIIFGSKARGDFHNRSDTDIAVDAEKPLGHSTLNGVVDMINLKTADDSLKKKIEKEGVVIYERKG